MSQRRKLVWARTQFSTAYTAAAFANWFDVLSTFRTAMGINANLPGCTVARTRIDLFAANLATGAPPLTVGLKVLTLREMNEAVIDPAYALGTSPQTETNADWMLWRGLYPNHGSDPTTGVPNAMTYEFDVKSMRRLDEAGETLGWCGSKQTTTAGYTVFTSISCLLALP